MIEFNKWDIWINVDYDCMVLFNGHIRYDADIWLDLYDENNNKKTIVTLKQEEVYTDDINLFNYMSKYKDDKSFCEVVISWEKEFNSLQLFGLKLDYRKGRKTINVGKHLRNIRDDFELEKHMFIYNINKK